MADLVWSGDTPYKRLGWEKMEGEKKWKIITQIVVTNVVVS